MIGSSADTYFQVMVVCFHSDYTKWHWYMCSRLLKDVRGATPMPPLGKCSKEAIMICPEHNVKIISHFHEINNSKNENYYYCYW